MRFFQQHRTGALALAVLVLALSAAQAEPATARDALAANKPALVCGTMVNPARKCLCTRDYRPVCARLANGARRNFANSCVAACAGARVIKCGKC